MSGFFPGSSEPIRPVPGLPDNLIVPEGKEYTIGGQKVELLSIGQVAEVLNRSTVTIRKWERNGVIPKATFSKPGANKDPRGRRRLYSKPQVEALQRIAMEEKILHDPNAQISRTQFTDKVFREFRRLAQNGGRA